MAKKPQIKTVKNGGCFDDLDIRIDDDVDTSKARPLDMFKQVLPALDKKNYNFYSSCTDKEKKSYSPLVIMRWMSSTNGDYDATHHFHLLNVNSFVNVDFWTLSNHPDLQHRLLAMCGTGQNQRHQWIPMIKKAKKSSKVDTFISKIYPSLNELELRLIKKSMTNEEYEQFLYGQGLQDKEVKSHMRDWKDEKKKGF